MVNYTDTPTSTPVEKLLNRLQGVRQTAPNRWTALCPAHPDRRPSLSIREAEGGRVLIHCFANCNAADIVAAVGLDLGDLFPPRDQHQHYIPGKRPRIPAGDVLRLIWHESSVVLAAAWTMTRGGGLSESDLARLELAFDRLTDAMMVAGGAR